VKGKLIVIEGSDSSGKTVQTRLLLERLQKTYSVATLDFPQYYANFFGRLIGRFLNGEFGDPTKIDPYTSSLLYAGDRLESSSLLLSWMAEGKIIVLNRYVPSNMAFNLAKIDDKEERSRYVSWLETLEYGTNRLPKPDLVLFLDVPIEVAQRLMLRKNARTYTNGEKKDKHEANTAYLARVHSEYQQLCQQRDNYIRIQCTFGDKLLDEREISDIVFSEVQKII
jgi:dTMP kinase